LKKMSLRAASANLRFGGVLNQTLRIKIVFFYNFAMITVMTMGRPHEK
jgi:hypothetical protein